MNQLPAVDSGDGAHRSVELAPRRVLVIDDDRDCCDMLAAVIEARGHETRSAYDALEATEILQSFMPDIVFLDIGLPGLSGTELVKYLRGIPALASIPVIAVTGRTGERDRKDAMQAGFTDYISKPVEPRRVREMVSEAPIRVR